MNDNSNQNNLQKQARRRIVGAIIFALLVGILLPFLMDNSHNQMLDEVAVNIPTQTENNEIPANNANPNLNSDPNSNANINNAENSQPADNENLADADENLEIPDVATSLNASPEEVTARIVQKQDSEKQKLTTQNQQRLIAENKENQEKIKQEREKAEKARLAKLEKEKEKEKIKNDDGKRAAAILAGNFDVAEKIEKTEKKAEKNDSKEKSNKKYIISIGTFSDENNVKNLLQKLSALKIATYTEKIADNKIRVRAGPFTTESDAKNALTKMQGSGISGNISAR